MQEARWAENGEVRKYESKHFRSKEGGERRKISKQNRWELYIFHGSLKNIPKPFHHMQLYHENETRPQEAIKMDR